MANLPSTSREHSRGALIQDVVPLDVFEDDGDTLVVTCQVEGSGASGSSSFLQPVEPAASRAGPSRSVPLQPPADDGPSGHMEERHARRRAPSRRAGRSGPGGDEDYSNLLRANLDTAVREQDVAGLKERAWLTEVQIHEKDLELKNIELEIKRKELELKEAQLQLVRQQSRIADADEETARLNQAKARLELQLLRDKL